MVMGFHPALAPVKAGVFPLTKKDGQPEMAHAVADDLRRRFPVFYDEAGAIGTALPEAGRGGHAVLHHHRRRLDEEPRRHDPLPRRHGPDPGGRVAGGGGDRDATSRRTSPSPTAAGLRARVTDALDALRSKGEAFLRDVSREYYSSHAGLKPAAELQPIYERHREAYGDESLELALGLLRDSPAGSEEHRSGRMLVEWLLESRVGRELAPLEEREIAWEGAAMIRLAGRRRGAVPPRVRSPSRTRATPRSGARSTTRGPRSSSPNSRRCGRSGSRAKRNSSSARPSRPDYLATFDALAGISLRRPARRMRRVPAGPRSRCGTTCSRSSSGADSASAPPRRRAPMRWR